MCFGVRIEGRSKGAIRCALTLVFSGHASNEVPQAMQNLAWLGASAPQAAQVRGRPEPHSMQNRALEGFFAPHEAQTCSATGAITDAVAS
jgi:hypothetical protein